MSEQSKVTVQCPKCNSDIEVTYWESLNGDINPEGKKALIYGNLFYATCKKCGNVSNLEYPILYSDMTNTAMILSVLSEDEIDEKIKNLEEYPDTLGNLKDFRKRIVRNNNELREKALIFDNGLDDRVIELAKIINLVNIRKDYPDIVEDKIYFDIVKEEYLLVFFLKDGRHLTLPIEKDNYTQIHDMARRDLDEKSNGLYIIDLNWAYSFFD